MSYFCPWCDYSCQDWIDMGEHAKAEHLHLFEVEDALTAEGESIPNSVDPDAPPVDYDTLPNATRCVLCHKTNGKYRYKVTPTKFETLDNGWSEIPLENLSWFICHECINKL